MLSAAEDGTQDYQRPPSPGAEYEWDEASKSWQLKPASSASPASESASLGSPAPQAQEPTQQDPQTGAVPANGAAPPPPPAPLEPTAADNYLQQTLMPEAPAVAPYDPNGPDLSRPADNQGVGKQPGQFQGPGGGYYWMPGVDPNDPDYSAYRGGEAPPAYGEFIGDDPATIDPDAWMAALGQQGLTPEQLQPYVDTFGIGSGLGTDTGGSPAPFVVPPVQQSAPDPIQPTVERFTGSPIPDTLTTPIPDALTQAQSGLLDFTPQNSTPFTGQNANSGDVVGQLKDLLPGAAASTSGPGGGSIEDYLKSLLENQPSTAVGSSTRSAIEGALLNPSAYNNDALKKMFANLGEGIDDQYTQDYQRVREDDARRGISVSSIDSGRKGDLLATRKSAKEKIASELEDKAAQDYASARATAIAQGLSADQADAQARLAVQSNAINYGQFANSSKNDAQARVQSLLSQIFGVGQQGFQNDLNTAQFNQNALSDSDRLLLSALGLV